VLVPASSSTDIYGQLSKKDSPSVLNHRLACPSSTSSKTKKTLSLLASTERRRRNPRIEYFTKPVVGARRVLSFANLRRRGDRRRFHSTRGVVGWGGLFSRSLSRLPAGITRRQVGGRRLDRTSGRIIRLTAKELT